MKVRFTKTELDALTKKARKSGLSREGYCRRVLNGTEVKEAPPADVPVLIQEVRRVGNNLNQIMKRPMPSACWMCPSSARHWRITGLWRS